MAELMREALHLMVSGTLLMVEGCTTILIAAYQGFTGTRRPKP